MPKVIIIEPNISEEENERRKEILYDILSEIAYKHALRQLELEKE